MLLGCQLHSSINQKLFEKQLCNQSSHYEKYRQFPLHKGAITCYQLINTFAFSKDEWNTKEDHEKCNVRSVVCQKAPLRLKQCWTAKKIKLVALVVIELRLSEGISQKKIPLIF